MYREETSRVTRRDPGGNVGNLCNLFMMSVVSQMLDGSCAHKIAKKSTKFEIFSVAAPLEYTMGLPGLPGLCILGSR